jgi:Glycosyl hydrolases family 18
MRRIRLRLALAAAACTLALPGAALALAPPASALAATAGTRSPLVLPTSVYAPYFETWTKDSISSIATASGARYFTLAFIQTPTKGSCALTWNGVSTQPVPGGRYMAQVAALRKMGGDIVPSFGGYSADTDGTEIADSCSSVAAIAADYESVVTHYDVTRLDMDVESKSLGNKAGINRRNEAIAMLEAWAAVHGRTVQIVYTLGVSPRGLPADARYVLQSAVADGARVDIVNLMAFDYYDGTTAMGAAAISAAKGAHAELARIYPAKTSQQVWNMESITLLPGIDDNPNKKEVTTLADTRTILRFAENNALAALTIWAIQRDNGGCPGKVDRNSCSGIAQSTWAFSHLLETFTVGDPSPGRRTAG